MICTLQKNRCPSSTFTFAATTTTSSVLSQMFDLLAKHPDVQTKLRAELTLAGAHTGLDHNELMALPLLDAVCRETLRLWVVPLR